MTEISIYLLFDTLGRKRKDHNFSTIVMKTRNASVGDILENPIISKFVFQGKIHNAISSISGGSQINVVIPV